MEKFMVVAIVQARMGSKRLPGKVMKEVKGKPLIGYLLERLRKSEKIDKIVLATSVNKENEVLCDYVKSLGYNIFRGSEEDVLNRYYQVAKKYNAETVVRITGDCPLIDPYICDKLIQFYFNKETDYAKLSPKFAEGLDCEVFSFEVLEKADKNAVKSSEREHVTPFIKNSPKIYNTIILDNSVDEGKYRFTVDGPEDFKVVKNIITDLSKTESDFIDFQSIKKYLDSHPDIFKMNANIQRNEGYLESLKKDKHSK
jgi:spore coat polysaccharide biosynthesis protein SpsF (cytidylyltransferase family)